MIKKEKNSERMERKQQKSNAKPMSLRFPQVSSMVIFMDYYYKNAPLSFMQRTVNFFPSSAAYFLMECMSNDCIDGGFDLEPAVARMVKTHQKSSNGEFVCNGSNSSGHARIDYKIDITYNK